MSEVIIGEGAYRYRVEPGWPSPFVFEWVPGKVTRFELL